MSLTLSFDVEIAKQCGVNAAIVLNHIIYWLKYNQKNSNCQINGKIWMFESHSKIADFFEFLSEKQVRDAIHILVQDGIVVKEKHSHNKFNRTNWYTLSDEYFQKVFSKLHNCRIATDLEVSSEETISSDVYIKSNKNKEKKTDNVRATPSVKPQEPVSQKTKYDNVDNVSSSTDEGTLSIIQKYKLIGDQLIAFAKLVEAKLDTDYDSLAAWCKKFDPEKIEHILDHVLPNAVVDSRAAFFRALLNNKSLSYLNTFGKKNLAYLAGKKCNSEWDTKTCIAYIIIDGIEKELSLNINPEEFANALNRYLRS